MIPKILVAIAALASAGLVQAQNEAPRQIHKPGGDFTNPAFSTEFVDETAKRNLGYLEFAKMAEQKAYSVQSKQLAGTILKDHAEIRQQLRNLAAAEGLQLPDHMTGDDQGLRDYLKDKPSRKFDMEYTRFMATHLERDVRDFVNESNEGRDPATRAFAAKFIPVLQKELDMAARAYKTLRDRSATPLPQYR